MTTVVRHPSSSPVVDPKLESIVEKHAASLLEALLAEGYDAVGLAGGIVFSDHGPKNIRAHVFVSATSAVVDVDKFRQDVAYLLLPRSG